MRYKRVGVQQKITADLFDDVLGTIKDGVNPGAWPFVRRIDRIELVWTRHDDSWRVQFFEEDK